ncbi:MAG: citrate/2-methylcitrate synthase [Clostridia bacterium]|nr:citrate/2-methylcitrate synthase [Clostridia bacterium]
MSFDNLNNNSDQINDDVFLDAICGRVDLLGSYPPESYLKYNVKRGLRNADGTGVVVGMTRVGDVRGYHTEDGEKIPDEGRLYFRGYDVYDIVKNVAAEGRFGYEECCYLLLTGRLPDASELADFNEYIGAHRQLPFGFTEDMIMKAPSRNLMNKLARSVMASYSYDEEPDDISVKNVFRQSLKLIAQAPTMAAYAYQAKAHYFDGKSLVIHSPRSDLSTAENILYMLRPDSSYTRQEAETLDLCLMLHAEHGGGNNSTFTVRVVSSTGTDTFAAVTAAINSLKGPKHGGANFKCMAMLDDIKEHVSDITDEDQIYDYLVKILNREAFDGTGLIYGMGHAVYTLSDPRAVMIKDKAEELAQTTGKMKEFNFISSVEKLAPFAYKEARGQEHIMCANVDMYSGFVYTMLGIPPELFTPIFAISRIPGWCAHRIEELNVDPRIIRPAYKNVGGIRRYINIDAR